MALSHELFETPWVSFRLKDEIFAVPALRVQTMLAMPVVSSVPNTPPYIRGVIQPRGQVLPLLDLRLRLGMPIALDENRQLLETMDQRKEDHLNWLKELDASVRERRPFTLQTDPHLCAFGKWYDAYEPDRFALKQVLGKFDAPHKRIHALAREVGEFVARERFDEALDLIEETRAGALSEMVRLFDEFKKRLSETDNEVAIVLETDASSFAVAIDSVEMVESFDPATVEDLPAMTSAGVEQFVMGTARREKDRSILLLLDVDQLLKSVPDLADVSADAAAAPA